ncbi:ABC transporter permease [Roseibium sp.]|uniref:ABC transporter permease n=1 Tax=Roseibium sp. TaxID=1936156 RepID=UPI00326717F3
MMRIKDLLVQTVKSVSRNAVRSLLTNLGLTVGVAAYILLETVNSGTRLTVERELQRLGGNILVVQAVPDRTIRSRPDGGRQFDNTHFRSLSAALADTAAVAAQTPAQASVSANGMAADVTLLGVTEAYLDIRGWSIESGRGFSPAEHVEAASVCLLGKATKERLFGRTSPLGATTRVDNSLCTVIGSLQSVGVSSAGRNVDDLVLMPLTSAQRRVTGTRAVRSLYVRPGSDELYEPVKTHITAFFEDDESLGKNRSVARVSEMQFIARAITDTKALLKNGLLFVSGLFATIGVAGVMNATLLSVRERRAEIGIRMALGARAGDIFLQFLVEALVLSGLSCLLGAAAGTLASYYLADAIGLPFHVSSATVFQVVALACLTTVLFAALPALKAARIDPIRAIRDGS